MKLNPQVLELTERMMQDIYKVPKDFKLKDIVEDIWKILNKTMEIKLKEKEELFIVYVAIFLVKVCKLSHDGELNEEAKKFLLQIREGKN